ncbi:MAG: PEP-CTERM sorting domain-containing protein [Candidatus Gracilibacteria bacterium]|nr:PEP-CTERM sorting domain-containing protein [Candidatus Gracilibacteria bacterium]
MLKLFYAGILSLIMSFGANAAYFEGTFGFGSDYNVPSGQSLLTSSEVYVTDGVVFTGNNATGSFASLFGSATFDVAFNESIPLTVGSFNTVDFLHDFLAINLFGPTTNLQLAVDLLDINTVSMSGLTGLSVLGEVLIRDLSGFFQDTRANLAMEFSESPGAIQGTYNRSMSGNIEVVSVPEPSVLLLLAVGVIGVSMFRKKSSQDDYYGKMITA